MDRRRFLTGTAIVGLQSLAFPGGAMPGAPTPGTATPGAPAVGRPTSGTPTPAGLSRKTARRVRPGDPGWPSAAAWDRLNSDVGGNLLRAVSLLEGDTDSRRYLGNPLFIGDQPNGTQVSGWLDAWTPGASPYVVAAHKAADVRAAVNFARDNNLRLVVKGGGHSYQGTSNSRDSLLIWTRAMNGIVLHDSFVPEGCGGKVPAQPAVSLDSGVMWIDAYDAVTTKAGRYVQGGGCATVGVAGLIQSGGFGSFSKTFGTASASLLEAQIVTADGILRTVNACRDPNLFWALKGGGGGTWGVVTRITLRTHNLPELFGGASGVVKANSDDAYRALIRRVMSFYHDNLLNPHWGEQMSFGPDNTVHISMVCQDLDSDRIASAWNPLIEELNANPDLSVVNKVGAGTFPARHWWDAVYRKNRGHSSMIADPRPGKPETHAWWSGDQEQVGMLLYGFESAWLPASLLNRDQRDRFVDALFAASRHHEVELHFNKGLAGAPSEHIEAAADTAINPQALSAFALAIIADGGAPAYPGLRDPAADAGVGHKSKDAVSAAMRELTAVAPGAGSYVSESNFFERSWGRSFWGDRHLARLRDVKAKYDPDGLFFVHHGVGSEEWSGDGFVRVSG